MRDLDSLFAALSRSPFRRRFRLGPKETADVARLGRDRVLAQARAIIEARLAPARPVNDGKQTPMRGHPAFIAQHATATCCRGCLAKWHAIPAGHALTEAERDHVATAIARWLDGQAVSETDAATSAPAQLAFNLTDDGVSPESPRIR